MKIQQQIAATGRLIAIGGAEDKTSEAEILGRVLSFAPSDNRVVGVVTTASGVPEEVFDAYRQVFERLGAERVEHIDIRDRDGANDPARVADIRACGVIFMSGGDQMRLTNTLGASDVLDAIRTRRGEGAVVAGTSAGAACMSSTMIYGGGDRNDSLRKGAVRMSAGLAFVHDMIIDSHFLERGRFTRLMEVGATNPEMLGVGIGEDAGVILDGGEILEAIGPGHVVIVDSSALSISNVADVEEGEAISVANVVMHALTNGYGYDVRRRVVLRPEDMETLKSGGPVGDSRTEGAAGA
ncbi:cyanophycinase [Rhodobacteraceae bacterium WD3A24]|nr:cyanophycinase [Rhodobacteraceae bacterium WD3A24]